MSKRYRLVLVADSDVIFDKHWAILSDGERPAADDIEAMECLARELILWARALKREQAKS